MRMTLLTSVCCKLPPQLNYRSETCSFKHKPVPNALMFWLASNNGLISVDLTRGSISHENGAINSCLLQVTTS